MDNSNSMERLYNGLIKENPTFVLMLGMCPTLAVTTSAMNGLGMGLTTMVVLALSNMIISMLRNIIPDKVRIPAFIVVIASFVTMVELLLEAPLSPLPSRKRGKRAAPRKQHPFMTPSTKLLGWKPMEIPVRIPRIIPRFSL